MTSSHAARVRRSWLEPAGNRTRPFSPVNRTQNSYAGAPHKGHATASGPSSRIRIAKDIHHPLRQPLELELATRHRATIGIRAHAPSRHRPLNETEKLRSKSPL
jgi:hypothetical protein